MPDSQELPILTLEQHNSVFTESNQLIDSFISLGLDLSQAKKCAIKTIRITISELQIIDGSYFVGLKSRLNFKRAMILYIVEL